MLKICVDILTEDNVKYKLPAADVKSVPIEIAEAGVPVKTILPFDFNAGFLVNPS